MSSWIDLSVLWNGNTSYACVTISRSGSGACFPTWEWVECRRPRDTRLLLEAVLYRCCAGIPRPDLLERFRNLCIVRFRHRGFCQRVLRHLLCGRGYMIVRTIVRPQHGSGVRPFIATVRLACVSVWIIQRQSLARGFLCWASTRGETALRVNV